MVRREDIRLGLGIAADTGGLVGATELNLGCAGLIVTLTNSTHPHPETHFTGAELVFGYIKGVFTTGKPVRSAIQTVVVGGLAASAAFAIANALG